MKTLRFHTGRGGRFNNQGYITFIAFEKMQDSSVLNSYTLTDEVDEYGDRIMTDEAGNTVDYVMKDDGTGYIDDDGEYDSDNWVKEDSLSDKQVRALIEAYDEYNAAYWPLSDEAEIGRILKEHYLSMAQDAGLFND